MIASTSIAQAASKTAAAAATEPAEFGSNLGSWIVVGERVVGGTPLPGAEGNPELDLCFLCDCTGSMGSYIHAAQQNILRIVNRIMVPHRAKVRFGLISYRDHPPQECSYVTKAFPFTADATEMKAYVDTMSAVGGGDGPEAVTAALHDALHLPWRPNATKVIVLIADAPPHGLEPSGDGFPNGDPEGRDPLEIARRMAANGIACYSVGCEPALGGYCFARDFMCTLAEITGGQAVALSSADLLAEVIVNGSAEEISLTRLQREVEEEVARVRAVASQTAEKLSDAECLRRACFGMQQRGVVTEQMSTDGSMQNANRPIWHASPTQTLAGAKGMLCASQATALAAVPFTGPAAMHCMPPTSPPCPPRAAMSAMSPTVMGVRPFPPLVAMSTAPRTPAAPPFSLCQSWASAPAPQTSTSNVLKKDLISMGQVERLMARSSLQSAQR